VPKKAVLFFLNKKFWLDKCKRFQYYCNVNQIILQREIEIFSLTGDFLLYSDKPVRLFDE